MKTSQWGILNKATKLFATDYTDYTKSLNDDLPVQRIAMEKTNLLYAAFL
ncbi:hypothetical protein BH20BAC1_BH20BAC1_14970 [soil metagenome]